jgi:hypothetical protein
MQTAGISLRKLSEGGPSETSSPAVPFMVHRWDAAEAGWNRNRMTIAVCNRQAGRWLAGPSPDEGPTRVQP